MDEFDRAAELELLQRRLALKAQSQKSRFHLASEQQCIDCDDDIPEARRKLGGVERCIDCQGYFEQREKLR